MKKLMFLSLLLFMSISHAFAAGPPPLPPLPSQEKLDQLNELGRQNMLKYGAGSTTPIIPPKPSSLPVKNVDTPFAFDSTQSGKVWLGEKQEIASMDAEVLEASAPGEQKEIRVEARIFQIIQSIFTRLFSFLK